MATVLRIVPAKDSGVSGRSNRDVSGDRDGNEISERSEVAMEDAELDGCDVILRLRDFARTEWPRLLLDDMADICDVVRCRAVGGETAAGIALGGRSGDVVMVAGVGAAAGSCRCRGSVSWGGGETLRRSASPTLSGRGAWHWSIWSTCLLVVVWFVVEPKAERGPSRDGGRRTGL